ncbi:hypothetical protein DM01DRAFT_1334317 [Hesseltinella vesiculosa]|uniref:protein kinase C n=1 Tax=Hesseltinella vesiculosa TaxID=101127 RepID=A0A1X2GLV3_9FUNG|nr:hypothetical protein DM01DRAFT_1334317 [Hesseltinella vesiculosa]
MDQDPKIQELTARIEHNKKMRDKAIQIRPLLTDRNAISQCETEIRECQKYIDYFTEELHRLETRAAHRQSGGNDGSDGPGTPDSQLPPRSSSMGTSATVVSPQSGGPVARKNTNAPRKRYTNLDLLTTATPFNKPKVSLKLHELEYKLDVEKQMQTAIRHMSDLFERDPSGDRKRRLEIQDQLHESNEKLNLLKKALRKYKSLYIDEGDDDEDELETPARLAPGLRRPVTGKLLMEIVEARDLAHAPTRMIKSPSTVVVIKIDNNVVFSTRPSRSDRWFEQCEINVNKASEVEVAIYDQSMEGVRDRVSLPIGVFWLKITDIAEGLRRRKVQQESGPGWVSAEVAQQRGEGDSGIAPSPSQSRMSQGAVDTALPPSQQSANRSTDNGIEAWFDIEPSGKIALRLNFVREATGGRPLDRLGRAGAVRQRKEEVHEINGHQFVEKKFYNIMKCALCGDFLVKSGYQCEDCEYTCHPDCYGKVVTKCISKAANEKDADEDKLNHRIPHRFEPITNIGGNWCCHCGYMLPLGSRSARKCSECGITCHAKCAHLVPDFCGLSMKMANQMLSEIKAAKRTTIAKPKVSLDSSSSDLASQMSNLQLKPQPAMTPPPKTPPTLHQQPPTPVHAPAPSPIAQQPLPVPSPRPAPPPSVPTHNQPGYPMPQAPQRPGWHGPPMTQQPPQGPGYHPYPQSQPQPQQRPPYMPQQPPMRPPMYPPGPHPGPNYQVPPYQNMPPHGPPPHGHSAPKPLPTPVPHPQQQQPPYGHQPPPHSPQPPMQQPQQQPAASGQRKFGLESFNFLAVLGKGNFGKVMLAEDKADKNSIYAVKVLKKRFIIDNDEIESVRSEKRVFQVANRERHPFLIGLHSSFQTESRVYFVMEYVSGGDLMWHIQREPFSERRAKFYACEVLLALEYFHSQGIVYRDLKLDNIMLSLDGHIKIADYGLCKENMGFGQVTGTFCGTPEFMAPEILLEQKYGRAVDWWAYGVLIYEMLLGQSPFRGEDEEEIFDAILEDEILYPINMSRDSVGICQRLLTREPERRLGAGQTDAAEIKQHPFFRGVNWEDMLAKRVPPPFYPTITDRLDTSNFDEEFTRERVALTPIEGNLTRVDQQVFQGFSYVADWAPH